MKTLKVAVIAGDGIGPEVMDEGVKSTANNCKCKSAI